jgi:glutamine amidotransferase
MIGIIDYGSGNKHAILDIFSRLSVPAMLVTCAAHTRHCDKFVLPGVGAFDDTMRRLNSSGLRDFLDQEILGLKKPILGICVGMQIMTKGSEEGIEDGLGWFDGFTKRFDTKMLTGKPKLPHLGWNEVAPTSTTGIFNGVVEEKGFYFLHSYFVECRDPNDVAAVTSYGRPFASAIQRKNCFGCQFHPEKSHLNGLTLFKNFATL